MASLHVHNNENEIILNTPNRNEILKEGPPQSAKCNILGRGAYGTVFKAIFHAKQVAVKIINNLKDSNLQSMRNEANILGWRHRNIVRILKVESTPNFGIVIMERFTGQCLQTILDSIELSMMHKVFVTLDILAALTYCHKRGLLHLDVKPQNILVSFGILNTNGVHKQNAIHMSTHVSTCKPQRPRNYVCKLCDFGTSMRIDKNQQENAIKGNAKGTVRYMSPEALREESLTLAADIYSLGITMWQLQERKTPYHWIECNEVVAYQVVKNNLRPDFNTHLSESKSVFNRAPAVNVVGISQIKQKCFCENCSSKLLSYPYMEHIRQLLNLTEKATVVNLNSLEGLTSQRNNVVGRRPFQDLNSKANLNAIRDIRTEKEHHHSNTNEHLNSQDYNLSIIFNHLDCMKRIQKQVEFDFYQGICKACWHSDPLLRPQAEDLRKRLLQFL